MSCLYIFVSGIHIFSLIMVWFIQNYIYLAIHRYREWDGETYKYLYLCYQTTLKKYENKRIEIDQK